MTREELIDRVAGHIHADQTVDGARLIAEFSGLPAKQADDKNALEFVNSLFYWCLNNDHYPWAAKLIWNERLFNYNPRCTQMVWDEIAANNSLMLMGAASMSKSYGAGGWLLLDWVRDPEYTSVNLVGPSEDHLKDNLFTHLVTLHSQSAIPLPGVMGDLFIGLDPRKRKGAIRGIVIPIGKRPAGRLQGRKRVPRPQFHPKLGAMSRIRFFLDELEKIPMGVWKDIDNVFSNLDSDVDGFKLIGAFNPEDPNGQVSVRCEPEKGWADFDPEADERWVSKRGWRVLRLDAARCENVIEGKVVYPGLQTKQGFDRIIQNAGGKDTPGYWSMARACFPRGGAVYSIISDYLVERAQRTFLFAEEPVQICGGDLALEGGDAAELAFGRFGKAVGCRYSPTHDFPRGREVMFKDRQGHPLFRWAIQLDEILQLLKGDTVKMAQAIRAACLKRKVGPNALMLDRTGNGAGVHDLLKSLWSEQVLGVNYSEAATERKILEEDSKKANEEYGRVDSEMWFAVKKWLEFNFFAVNPLLPELETLKKELTGRRYIPGKLTKIESKVDYKSRGNPSPNKADATTLLVHVVRVGFGCTPSALDNVNPEALVGTGPTERGPMPVLIGETDKFTALEDAEDGQDWIG